MSQDQKSVYFTIDFHLVSRQKPMLYNIYINSSTVKDKDHYVKIVKPGEVLTDEDVEEFKKYQRIHVLESERGLYLQSLAENDDFESLDKVTAIKDSAVKHLDDIFNPGKEFNTEILGEALDGCHDSMKAMVGVIKDYDINSLKNLIGELSFHDFYTYDHSINVSMYSVLIYKQYRPKASEADLVAIGLGGLLHDLGKTKISTEILNKSGGLSDEEFAEIKKHPELGVELFREANPDFPGLKKEAIERVIVEHHENIDGSGYPKGLKGPDHHIFSKVVSVADFFDAITTKRSYSQALPIEDALEIMKKTVGKKIDAEIFDFFVKKVSKVILTGKTMIELPEDFNTEIAHAELPVQKVQPKKLGENFTKAPDNPNKIEK